VYHGDAFYDHASYGNTFKITQITRTSYMAPAQPFGKATVCPIRVGFGRVRQHSAAGRAMGCCQRIRERIERMAAAPGWVLRQGAFCLSQSGRNSHGRFTRCSVTFVGRQMRCQCRLCAKEDTRSGGACPFNPLPNPLTAASPGRMQGAES